MRIVKAGALYCVVVFTAGAILGPIRELWIIPIVGRIVGILLEAPLMLAAMILAARWTSWRLAVPSTVEARVGMGLVALGLLLLTELTMALLLGGMSFMEYVETFRTAFGAVSLLLFLLFAAMPMLVVRKL
jgi:hypothetical protein